MTQERWSAVDELIEDLLLQGDPALQAAAASSDAAGIPQIAVSPAQGRFLRLLVEIHRPRLILELGALGGFSTICLASGLEAEGRVVSVELNPAYAALARANVAAAGLADRVEIRVGPALEVLAAIEEEEIGPFDLTFIDADKEPTAEYFEWALRLSGPGSVIIADNVVRGGRLADPGDDPRAQGMRRFHELLAREERVQATTIQTVGSKGYDGFTMALVKS